MMAVLASDAILHEQATHRSCTDGDATLLVNRLTELLERGSGMGSDERSQSISGDLLVE